MKLRQVIYGILGLIVLIGAIGLYFHSRSNSLPKVLVVPLGLPPIEWPVDNPYTAEKAELGRLLFFDERLSSNDSISCATCHKIPKAFADPNKLSVGILGHVGTRHTPTIINVVYNKYQFWDGRAATLEEQVLGPISNLNEMTLAHEPKLAYEECVKKIRELPEYQPLFKKIFHDKECTLEDIAKAIATFERTILSGNSPFDRYLAGDKSALTPSQIHGMVVFKKASCVNCHGAPLFTNNRFENIGIGMDMPNPDLGRYNVTHESRDWGAFKVPTLREVSLTGPYMHDGSLKTLEDVVDYYDRGGIPNKNLHPLIRPLHLTEQDKKDLISFMEALNGEGWQMIKEGNEP